MVGTRMDRVENLEKEFAAFKGTMEQNMKTIMSFMEKQAENQDGRGDPSAGDAEANGEQSTEREERREGRRNGWNGRGEAPVDSRLRRLELPIFEGQDPVGWIIKIERFLVLSGFPQEEWLSVAIIALDGKALSWFTWAEARKPFRSWQILKQEILDRFQGKQDSLGCEVLLALRQEGNVDEFREKFEALASMHRGVSEEVLIGAFTNGLKEEIAVEVRMFRPEGLGNIMSLAQAVERRNEALKRVENGFKVGRNVGWGGSNPGFSFQRLPPAAAGLSSNQNKDKSPSSSQASVQNSENTRWNSGQNFQRNSTNNSGTKAGTVRRLTEEEHRRCREQGLCFKCFERYSPNHICKQKQLHVLIVAEEEEKEEAAEEEVQEQ